MALRHVSPLSHEDWVALAKDLKKGPSPKHAKVVQDAIDQTKHLKATLEE